jgi:hypothetical protein
MNDYITPQERADYGEEFLDIVKRQARSATAGQVANLQQGLQQVQNAIAREQRDQMKRRLDRELPSWRSQNDDPAFIEWLQTHDACSGRTRHALLQEAWASNVADRVIAIFRAFASEGRPQRQQRYQQRSTHPSGQWIRQADIEQFYKWIAEGKYEHRQKEKEEAERELFQALNEGRVIP